MTNVITTAPAARSVRATKAALGIPTRQAPSVGVEYQRACFLIRRLGFALLDLGLDETLPESWVTPTSTGLDFASLTLTEAEDLVQSLEDRVADRSPRITTLAPEQLQLFEIEL